MRKQEGPPDAVRRFLDENKPAKSLAGAQSVSEFVSRLDQFRPRIQQFLDGRRARDQREAPEFNLFELLRLQSDEAMHSRFLANLLNPAGTHGQGAFFLNHFLRHCHKHVHHFPKLLDRDLPDTAFVFVKPEFHSAFGRPDIVVFSRDAGFALIIENKVYAGDQEDQLERYWKLLQSNFNFARHRKALLYLTRSGRKPKGHVPGTVRYSCLGYRNRAGIAQWLRSCAERVPEVLRPILLQYADMAGRLPAEAEEENGEDEAG